MTPDITFTEARNEALATAFNAVDYIASQSLFELSVSPFTCTVEGLIISLGLYSSRSEETIYESIHFTWDELLDPVILPRLPDLAKERWDAARAASISAEEKAHVEREAKEKRRRERERQEASARLEAKEREELKRLLAKYGEDKG